MCLQARVKNGMRPVLYDESCGDCDVGRPCYTEIELCQRPRGVLELAKDSELIAVIQNLIRSRQYLFTIHAADRMTERHIAVEEIEEALLGDSVEVVEDYRDDPRGSSCLILGFTDKDRPLHVHCTRPPGLTVITAYEPDDSEWENGFRMRHGGSR